MATVNASLVYLFHGLGIAAMLIIWICFGKHLEVKLRASRRPYPIPKYLDELTIKQVKPGMSQLDPLLWRLIKTNHIIEPSKEDYNLHRRKAQTSYGQGQSIAKLFQNMRSGFFVECGALDGETSSNTLSLERDLGWTGLLIEGDPTLIQKIRSKNRKSRIVPNCLSTSTETSIVDFGAWFQTGRILSPNERKLDFSDNQRVVSEVTCLPLYAVLKAAGITHVDYFSLDVEGNELDILKTVPFDLVDITALSVEFMHIGEKHTGGSKNELVEFMKSKGYKMRATVRNAGGMANDYIFVKDGFNEHIKLDDIST